MTVRPAFGDFLTAARGHASAAVAGHQADRSGEHVQEITDSLLHVITVMGRYLQDIAAVPGSHAVPHQPAADRMGTGPPYLAGRAHPRRPALAARPRQASTRRGRPQ